MKGAKMQSCDSLSSQNQGHQVSSVSPSYMEEWRQLQHNIRHTHDMAHLQSFVVQGGLRNSKFRSVYWRIYLGVLYPSEGDADAWPEVVHRQRAHYSELKAQFVVHHEELNTAAGDDDPLSQKVDSPWHRYFVTHSIRKQIQQDVARTFPELQFFQSAAVHQSMVNILSCYAMSHPHVGYRQGMHEILAPLLFVLQSDLVALEHAQECPAAPEMVLEGLLPVLLARNFLEHDAYAMFCAVMEHIHTWYLTDVPPSTSNTPHKIDTSRQPFQSEEENSVVQSIHRSPILEKLNVIFHVLLKKEDRDLYQHMQQLDIVPQVYGLRWLRLLFGREFPLQDLLVVWDALFALQNNFLLVHYIFVAMLMEIRHLLLTSDYSQCMHHLMRYPHVMDVNFLVDSALNLYSPSMFHKPLERRRRVETSSGSGGGTLLARSRTALEDFKSKVLPSRKVITVSPSTSAGDAISPTETDMSQHVEMTSMCSDVLDTCVQAMHSLLLDQQHRQSNESEACFTADAISHWHVAVAAIKLVRDTLRGDLVFDRDMLALSMAQISSVTAATASRNIENGNL